MRYESTTEPQQKSHTGTSLAQLAQHLQKVQLQPYVQVWIHKENGESLGAYFNPDFASVGWMTDDGTSADVFDPHYDGPGDAVQQFYIENGQLDEYPERNCIARSEGIRALLFFFEHGNKPDWLHWRDN